MKKKQKFTWQGLWQSAKEGLKPEWKDLYWIAAAVITCLIAVPIILNIRQEREMEHNRAMLASAVEATPTCPGIADLAGNCMEQVEYHFTVEGTETPAPVCTPVYCPAGELVCPTGDCPGGCGMICALDITPTALPQFSPPGLVCVYFYPQDGSAPESYCYNNPTR